MAFTLRLTGTQLDDDDNKTFIIFWLVSSFGHMNYSVLRSYRNQFPHIRSSHTALPPNAHTNAAFSYKDVFLPSSPSARGQHCTPLSHGRNESLELCLMPSNNNHIVLLCLDNNICREKLLSLRSSEREAANASLYVVFNFWVCISRIQRNLFIYLRVYSAATFAFNFMAIGRR